MAQTDYDEIRPYNDSEVPEKLKLLLNDPAFKEVFRMLFHDPRKEKAMVTHLEKMKSVEQLQSTFVYQIVERIIKGTTDGITTSGLDYLDNRKAYLFVSNHRDIILDAAFLNYVILRNGMNTTQIAIGGNLLIFDWITHIVKLNRAFIIKRNITVRELLDSSMKVSSYIRSSITENNISVWIAQKEGRTKDGNDLTQVSLLKMLNLSNKKGLVEGFGELTIVPLSISYEIEPCGISKVHELIRRDTDGYQKTPDDDLKSMASGMANPKGKVHFSFGKPILESFLKSHDDLSPNEFIEELAIRIDHRIHQYYKLFPYNYVAYDLLNGTGEFIDNYTSGDMVKFNGMIAEAQKSIPYPPEEVAKRFCKMYARPVENSIVASEIFRI